MNDVLILLLAAVVVVSIFRWLRISQIIGYLFAGILIGPYALEFITEVEQTTALGHFGVVFLLFTIGLKLPLNRLQSMKRYVFGLGFAQVVISALFLGTVTYFLGGSIEGSILIGSVLALSSTAVGLQLLTERGELSSRFGRATFSILLFQDLAVVVLLVLLTTIGQEGVHVVNELGRAALNAGIVLAVITLVGYTILRPVYRAISSFGNQELFVAMTLLVVLATSMTTKAVGLSMELGAFLAGILLSETEYKHQVEADIEPFYGLLLGLFFMTVGMGINLQLLSDYAAVIAIFITIFMVGKIVITTALCRLFSMPTMTAFRTSLLLAGGGEFVFVIATPAIERGLVEVQTGQILFVCVAISMGLTPFLNILGKYLEDYFTESEATAVLDATVEEIGDLRNHVIISGFGRVGKLVAEILAERMIPFVAIDRSMKRVTEGRSMGYPVYYGDARRPHVMRALRAEKAKVIVVSLNNNNAALRTAIMARKNFPDSAVAVRMRDDEYEEKLTEIGASIIMPQNLEPSLQLAASVLSSMGSTTDEVTQTINNFRQVLAANDSEEEPEQEAQAS